MIQKKIKIFEKIFREYSYNLDIFNSIGIAKNNFALIKYWGKENEELMIPFTSSLSFQLEDFYGTKVEIEKNHHSQEDILIINDQIAKRHSYEYEKFYKFLKNFKKINKKIFNIHNEEFFIVKTQSNIPIAAGLASSASFFAALTKALFKFYHKIDNDLYEANIHQSIIARIGSISASRSIIECEIGEFTLLNKYKENSFSHSIKHYFNNLYCGTIVISEEKKKLKSSQAMNISIQNKNYSKWVENTNQDLENILDAIKNTNLKKFFTIIMNNSEALCDLLKEDNICYDLEKTIKIKDIIKSESKNNNLITFTQDAGANLKIISNNKNLIQDLFKKEKIFISKIL